MDNIILGGDFNVCLNENDHNSETHHKDKSIKIIALEIENINLLDAWHNINDMGDHYTWSNTEVKCRHEYYFISKGSSYK